VTEAFAIAGVALAVGIDVLALSTAIGVKGPPWRQRIVLGAAFSAAEIAMLIAGLTIGAGVGHVLGTIAQWIGLAVLAGIGAWMLYEGFSQTCTLEFDVVSPGGLMLAALSISLDSLGVGFALPLLRLPLIPLVVTVAVSTTGFTLAGLAFGALAGRLFEKNAERAAGIVLVAIALLFAVKDVTAR